MTTTDKAARLALIKARFAAKPSLTPMGAAIVEELREEDSDLAIKDLTAGISGEDEKWEVEGKPSIATEDEENEEASDEFASDALKGVFGLKPQRWEESDTEPAADDEDAE